jgi:hypothetical protein
MANGYRNERETASADNVTKPVQLFQARVFVFLVADIFPDHFLVAPHGRNEISSGPKVLPNETSFSLAYTRAIWMALLPLMYPTT